MFKSTQELSVHNLRRKAVSRKKRQQENPNENSPILYIDVLCGKCIVNNGKKCEFPYCVVEFESQTQITDVAREKPQSDMSEVLLEWNESFMFQVTGNQNNDSSSGNNNNNVLSPRSEPNAIKIHVYNRKFLAKDSNLGVITIPLDSLINETVIKKWYKLPPAEGIEGSIMLKIQYSASDRGKMNLLQELIPDKFYDKLYQVLLFGELSPLSFVLLFDNDGLIPNTAEIDSLLKLIISSESESGINRNRVLEILVNSEVKASMSNIGTLFRRNSLCSKILTSYLNYYGNRYLIGRFQSFIQQLDEEDLELEVDPHKVSPDQKVDTKKNMSILLKKTEELIKKILETPNELPYEIRESNAILAEAVSRVFANENKGNAIVHTAVGGAIFLRFICPALVSPHLFGLLKDAPKRRTHRTLIIMTKILQNLANGVEFGKKEDFMIKANKLIKNHRKNYIKFIEAVIPETLSPIIGEEIEPVQMLWSMYNTHSYLHRNWSKIIDDLNSPKDGAEYAYSVLKTNKEIDVSNILKELSKVKLVLDSLGEPVELKKKTQP
jgi:hypothetical protein